MTVVGHREISGTAIEDGRHRPDINPISAGDPAAFFGRRQDSHRQATESLIGLHLPANGGSSCGGY
jgi:hypothetical protein